MSQIIQAYRRPEVGQRAPAQPFLKWAGGKKRLLPTLLPLLPERIRRYFEPFIGGGAMFFNLAPKSAVVSDINEDLINVYSCVRRDVDALIEDLRRHRYDKEYYYAMRALDPADLSPIGRASRMIYLNRTCFNGLYRVNRRGQFNVPIGRYKNPTICPEDRLRAASETLQGAALRCVGYQGATEECRAGDFVYFDPPYHPTSRTANFTSYTAGAFSFDDQIELSEVFADLSDRGVHCMLSNSDTLEVRGLYRHFRVDIIEAPRAISRDPSGRKAVTEVLVRNY